MFSRVIFLFERYRTAHLAVDLPGQPMVDRDGTCVGYVDRVRVQGGRLQVQGWAQAVKLRLILGGAEMEMAPVLRRPDVASALNIRETVGFDLSVPARISDIENSDPPGLVVMREEHQSPVDPISLPIDIPARARFRCTLAFARDVGLSLPAMLGWALTRNLTYRARVKRRLRLDPAPAAGLLKPGLFQRPGDRTDISIPEDRITIVLPVYNAFELLKECLERVERYTDLPWCMILVEDASTDERVRPFLREWARTRPNVTLLENRRNAGFIASVNRGLEHALAEGGTGNKAGEGPVVLLNSDALVPEGWASRLVRPLYLGETVASVTPMSSDAEIFSVPQICARTVMKPGQADAIDRVAQSFAPDAFVADAPTGVGFCMAIGRKWLAREPRLDTAFGRGYGEEVDWCQKVARRGGRHVGLPNLFVEHRGGESFGSSEKAALIAKNGEIVSRRYSDYDQRVQDFIAADPMRTPRMALALAWAGSLDPDTPVPVYLAHSMGGGADLWLEKRISEDLENGRPSVVLRVGGSKRFQLEVVNAHGRCLGQTNDVELAKSLLAILPRRKVIYSCGVGDPDPAFLPELLTEITQEGDEAEMLFHDFFPLSPSFNLLDHDGFYRGPVVPPRTDPAHSIRRPDGTQIALADWQAKWKTFAKRAELVVFSDDSAAQVAAVWPDLRGRIQVRPHRMRHKIEPVAPPNPDAPIVIAVLGNIGAPKGAAVVQAVARRLDKAPKGAPRLVLIGNIDPAYALPNSTVVHGSYAVQDLPKLITRYGITHWLIPSIWPETFCYAAHEALATGLPVMAFALGAQGQAVARARNGVVLPFDSKGDLAQKVLEALQATTVGVPRSDQACYDGARPATRSLAVAHTS